MHRKHVLEKRRPRRGKKAQIIGQIFVYLAGIIVIGLIVMYGYNAVLHFQEKTQDVALISFKTSLERSLQELSVEYGSVKMKRLDVPAEFSEVCFVDTRDPDDDGYDASHRKNVCDDQPIHPIVCNFWMDMDTIDNVFLIGPKSVEPFFIGDDTDPKDNTYPSYFLIMKSTHDNAPPIITDGWRCYPSERGRITVRLEGIGRGVSLGG